MKIIIDGSEGASDALRLAASMLDQAFPGRTSGTITVNLQLEDSGHRLIPQNQETYVIAGGKAYTEEAYIRNKAYHAMDEKIRRKADACSSMIDQCRRDIAYFQKKRDIALERGFSTASEWENFAVMFENYLEDLEWQREVLGAICSGSAEIVQRYIDIEKRSETRKDVSGACLIRYKDSYYGIVSNGSPDEPKVVDTFFGPEALENVPRWNPGKDKMFSLGTFEY